MGLWVAILITLAVLGSVLWVKPSSRERMLTAYRTEALAKGMKVRLLDAKLAEQIFPWIDNYRQFVFYEKNLPASAKFSSYKPLIVRLSDDLNAHELDGNDPVKDVISTCASYHLLPNTVEAVVISASGISILWREIKGAGEGGSSSVDIIDQFLLECISLSKIWM